MMFGMGDSVGMTNYGDVSDYLALSLAAYCSAAAATPAMISS